MALIVWTHQTAAAYLLQRYWNTHFPSAFSCWSDLGGSLIDLTDFIPLNDMKTQCDAEPWLEVWRVNNCYGRSSIITSHTFPLLPSLARYH